MKKIIEVPDKFVKKSRQRFQVQAAPGPHVHKIDWVDSNITYEEFFEKYLIANKPCIISQELTKNWKSVQNWVDSKSGKPNFNYLKENFGKNN